MELTSRTEIMERCAYVGQAMVAVDSGVAPSRRDIRGYFYE